MSMESTREPITNCARAGAPEQPQRGHSTPDPETPPSQPPPSVPDSEPAPEYAPVKEPTLPEPPIKA
jgi:hypothetical protein